MLDMSVMIMHISKHKFNLRTKMTSKNATIRISLRNDKIVDQTYKLTIYKQAFYQISLKRQYSLISAKLNTEKHKKIDKLTYMKIIIA